MATYTTRNTLTKPGYADAADIADINTNMDTIDASFAKCNWAATTAPAVTDDSGDGYAVGSVWLDVTNNNIYVAKSVSVGAAVWTKQAAHNNYSATGAPTVNDDLDLHYAPGSMWVDTTNHNVYVCESAANGAALWKQVNSATISGYVKQDGSTPLTADWDVGAYHITADHFISDVATGTAPFSSTSTTLCTNLNADRLDSREGTAYAILAGQAGGQTLNGGTAASDGLVLNSTSHGTKGNTTITDGNLVVGTKATTSTFAIAIHEGASAAPNYIYFMDADGTTPVGGIFKSSADSLSFAAGDGTTADFYISSAGNAACNGSITGVGLTSSAGVSSNWTRTDVGGSCAIAGTARPTFTSDQTSTQYNIYSACFPEVRTGKTNSGNVYSFYTETMRNHNGAATDDGGTQNGLYAQQAFFGHYNTHADEAPLTTYCSGVRVSPYYTTGTITNLYCVEISTASTGGTVTNNWAIYNAHSGNTYTASTYTRIGTTSGNNILYVVASSSTDPIADDWTKHCTTDLKEVVEALDTKEKRKAVKDDFKTRPLKAWKHKQELSREHYEAMFPIEDDRPRGPESDLKPAKDLAVRQAEQDYRIQKHLDKIAGLKKFTRVQYGLHAADAPEAVQAFDEENNVVGIGIGAYVGWLHTICLAQEDEIDDLKAQMADVLQRLDKLEKKNA